MDDERIADAAGWAVAAVAGCDAGDGLDDGVDAGVDADAGDAERRQNEGAAAAAAVVAETAVVADAGTDDGLAIHVTEARDGDGGGNERRLGQMPCPRVEAPQTGCTPNSWLGKLRSIDLFDDQGVRLFCRGRLRWDKLRWDRWRGFGT